MMGRPPKHPALRNGHRRHSEMAVASSGQGSTVPRIPTVERELMDPKVRPLWRMLWQSGTASAWDRAAAVIPVARYLVALSEWRRYSELVRKAPMLRGSKDQLQPNPLISQLRALERELRTFEEQFGLSPRSGILLGLNLATGLSLLDKLNDLNDSAAERLGPEGGAWKAL